MKLKHLFENKLTAQQAYNLAEQKGTRIPEYEDIIAKDSQYACWYANNVIKGRFPAGEPAIAKNSNVAFQYKLFLYNNDINFDDLEKQSSEKGPLIIDKHIISDIPNKVKDSQLIKLIKLSFPDVEDKRIVKFLLSKKQSSNSELPVITWKEYMKKKKRKYQPKNLDDFS